MEWFSILLLLLCPFIMLFCMKGHTSGHKHHSNNDKMLEEKLEKLSEENKQLKKAIDRLMQSDK